MTKLKVAGLSVSVDGFCAGPGTVPGASAGPGRPGPARVALRRAPSSACTAWGGGTGVDDDFARHGFEGMGAWILGRHVFGPVRGPWPDDTWRGWWGDEPPHHAGVRADAPCPGAAMAGSTVTSSSLVASTRPCSGPPGPAQGRDVRLGGGADTIRQCLRAGTGRRDAPGDRPVLLGRGETLLGGIDLPALGFEVVGGRRRRWRCMWFCTAAAYPADRRPHAADPRPARVDQRAQGALDLCRAVVAPMSSPLGAGRSGARLGRVPHAQRTAWCR